MKAKVKLGGASGSLNEWKLNEQEREEARWNQMRKQRMADEQKAQDEVMCATLFAVTDPNDPIP
jgi:hypothetical protein